MDAWELDSIISVKLTVKLALELVSVILVIILGYTKIIHVLMRRHYHNHLGPSRSDLAATQLSLDNMRLDFRGQIEMMEKDHAEDKVAAFRDGQAAGERAGHAKGYEAGKIDSTRDFRLEFADFLTEQAARLRDEVEDVDKQDLPPIPLPNRPKAVPIMPPPSGSGWTHNPYGMPR